MRIEILNTGTELLLGNTVNTHAAWLGRELFQLGLRITRQTTVPDGEAIRESIREAMSRADVLIVTGGLGPTSDDLTREITADVLGLKLILDEAALRTIEEFFALRGRPMAAANHKQALFPDGSEVLANRHGTAPGVYVAPGLHGQAHGAIFLLPGPPRELYPMFQREVAPRLRALTMGTALPAVLTLKFTGIGESDFHEGLDAELAAIADLEYGYCAHISEVDLRLIGTPDAITRARTLALGHFAECLISDDESSLEATVVRLLSHQNLTLATAESCTGGLIANRLTDVPGASMVFTHGFVTYANAAKIDLLGVAPHDLATHGAVSEIVACQMADGALRASGADIAVAVTGIAGPDGGTAEKPVGSAWIALATRGSRATAAHVFHPRQRLDFKLAVSQAALEAVRRVLMGIPTAGAPPPASIS